MAIVTNESDTQTEEAAVEKPDTKRRRGGVVWRKGIQRQLAGGAPTEPVDDAVRDAIWRSDKRRLRIEIGRGTGYVGKLEEWASEGDEGWEDVWDPPH